MIESELESSLRGYLQTGEHIRWTGRPAQGFRTSSADVFLIPFSLLWGGFAIFWESSVLATGAPGFFALWGIPFVGVGLYIIAGRFFVDAWVRDRTIYAVTERRALLLRNVFSERLIATNLDGEVRLKKESGERGTIEFGPQVSPFFQNRSFTSMTPALGSGVNFIGVDDVMRVYKLLGSTPAA